MDLEKETIHSKGVSHCCLGGAVQSKFRFFFFSPACFFWFFFLNPRVALLYLHLCFRRQHFCLPAYPAEYRTENAPQSHLAALTCALHILSFTKTTNRGLKLHPRVTASWICYYSATGSWLPFQGPADPQAEKRKAFSTVWGSLKQHTVDQQRSTENTKLSRATVQQLPHVGYTRSCKTVLFLQRHGLVLHPEALTDFSLWRNLHRDLNFFLLGKCKHSYL